MQDMPIFPGKLKNRGAILAIRLASLCLLDVPWSVAYPIQNVYKIYNKVTEMYNKVSKLAISS
jgi:hypothetical protein